MKKRTYHVVAYDGNTWVMKRNHPILWFSGISEEIQHDAEHAAGMLGIRDHHEDQQRYERAQKQMEMILEVPGIHLWSDADRG